MMIEKDCDNWKFSSNIKEVIRVVLKSLFIHLFFLQKDFAHTKSSKKHKTHQKHKNATKQKHKNANKQTKIKNAPKKHLRGKSNLFAYLRFLVFCAREEKKIKNGK